MEAKPFPLPVFNFSSELPVSTVVSRILSIYIENGRSAPHQGTVIKMIFLSLVRGQGK